MCLPKAIPGSISLMDIATYGEVAGLICALWPISGEILTEAWFGSWNKQSKS
jgi:hypothetical protein